MKQGAIWMVNFDPSVGHEYRKARPAVIITADKIIKYSNLVTVLPISSGLNNCLDDDIKIFKDEDNRLFTDSTIRVNSISSFDKGPGRFIKKIGVVNDYIMEQIKKSLKTHFDIK